MTNGPSLLLNIVDSVATLTIARPAKRNALDTAAWQALAETCAAIAVNGDVRAVVLQGEGAHFSAGADIHELREHIRDTAWMAYNQAAIARALDTFAALPQPTIAVIRGVCYGGGAALAAASDFRLCTTDATFAITPSKLGLTYRLVDCLRVVELVGAARAREILLLAKEVDAATAVTWGMVTECVEPASLPSALAATLAKMTSLSSYSVRGIKQSLLKIRVGQTNDDAQIKQIFADAFKGQDFAEGAAAFVEKRTPEFD
jgi:enoyl-CoA hydratase/carnithine racemase